MDPCFEKFYCQTCFCDLFLENTFKSFLFCSVQYSVQQRWLCELNRRYCSWAVSSDRTNYFSPPSPPVRKSVGKQLILVVTIPVLTMLVVTISIWSQKRRNLEKVSDGKAKWKLSSLRSFLLSLSVSNPYRTFLVFQQHNVDGFIRTVACAAL